VNPELGPLGDPESISFSMPDLYSCCVACITTENCYASDRPAAFPGQEYDNMIGTSCPANRGGLACTFGTKYRDDIIFVSNGLWGYWEYEDLGGGDDD